MTIVGPGVVLRNTNALNNHPAETEKTLTKHETAAN